MSANETSGAGHDRGARVFENSQAALTALLQPGEPLIGTMLTMFRRRGWMKRCVIGTTPARMIIVPIRLDGSTKAPPIEIRREDVLRWNVHQITNGIGMGMGAELKFSTRDGKFQINPPLDIGIPEGFDQKCVVDFLNTTGS